MNRVVDCKANRILYAAIFTFFFFAAAAGQSKERIVDWQPNIIKGNSVAGGCKMFQPTEHNALEIMDIKVGDKPIVPGQSFVANEMWLKDLSVKVRNISGKPISSVRLSINLPEAKKGESTMSFSIGFRDAVSIGFENEPRKFIAPGEEVVLTRNNATYDRDNQVIAKLTERTEFSRAFIGMTLVNFQDGKAWMSGMLPLQSQNVNAVAKSPIVENVGRRISGTVLMKSDGQPIGKALVEIKAINDKTTEKILLADCASTDAQGRWSIDNVPDGQYRVFVGLDSRLSAVNNKGENSPAVTAFVAKTYEVKIAGADVNDFAMEVSRGGTITGKIVMENGELLPKNLIVLPEQTTAGERSPVRMGIVEPDGSFVLQGVPSGLVRIKAVVFTKPNEYQMKAATVNNLDLLREPLKVEDGVEIKDVRITFAKSMEK